jgi:type IV pilus assembly protein PilM
MPFRQKQQIVGLDIGSAVIKAVELTPLKRGHTLSQYGHLELPTGTIEQGAVANMAHLSDALSELFQRYDFKTRQVALALNSQTVVKETIALEKSADDYLYERVLLESEHHIPFGLEEVNIDFHVIGDHPVNPHLMDILVVAAKKETINAYLQATAAANLKACIVDVDLFALQNSFYQSHPHAQETVALIDIGAQSTLFCVVQDGLPLFSRNLPFGCRQIDLRIAQQQGCSEAEAQRIKFGDSVRSIATDQFYRLELDITNRWCTEIGQTVKIYSNSYSPQSITHIYLSGGGANVPVFRQQLALETGLKIDLLDPIGPIVIKTDRFDTRTIRGVAPQAAISVGLALRRANDK